MVSGGPAVSVARLRVGLLSYFAPASIIFILGLWDDVWNLRARPKLLAQVLAASLYLLMRPDLIRQFGRWLGTDSMAGISLSFVTWGFGSSQLPTRSILLTEWMAFAWE